jgi:hypothetical protein
MKNKKIEQSIISIALVLLLCGYYTAPHATISNRNKNTETKNAIPVPLREVENRVLHIQEALYGDGLDENGACRFEITKTDSI